MTPDTAALRALVDTYVTGWYLTAAEVRALCDAADEVERLRADRDALREQVQRLRASRESNRGGWARTLVERDALRAAVDRVRALGERDGRDLLAAWLASNGVEQPDTVAVEAAAFVLAALESGNYGTPEWFSSIDKPLFPLSEGEQQRFEAADEVERLREDVEALHGLLSAGAIGTAPGSDSHRMVLAMRDHYKRQRDASRAAHAALVADLRAQTVDELADLLIAEWKLVDPTSDVAKYPVSYVATFADLARAVIAHNATLLARITADTTGDRT